VPLDGAVPFAASFDVAGWFARDPDVFERVGAVLLGDDAKPTPMRRVLIADDAFALVERKVADALQAPVERVGQIVGRADHVTVSPEGLEQWMEVFRVVQGSEIWANHGDWITQTKPKLGQAIAERLSIASKLDPAAISAAHVKHAAVLARLDALIGEGDVLVLPTSPRVAPRKGTEQHELEVVYRYQAMCLLCISGLGGLPQINLPLAVLDGCPLGLSIIGRRGSDMALMRLARKVMEHEIR
jgi:amidase